MEHSGFFDGGTEYGQAEFNRYFDNIYESGIAMNEDNSFQYPITIGSGAVSVGIGFSILRGFFHYNDSAKDMTLAPNANLPVIYRIILQLNSARGIAQLVARAGTAASSPKPPELTQSDTIFEISLGQYKVSTSGAITLVKDERSDVTVCGAIRPKHFSEWDAAMKEAKRQWEEWFAEQQGLGWRNIFVQADEPEEKVSGSIWIQST